jgi:hypothetical protein
MRPSTSKESYDETPPLTPGPALASPSPSLRLPSSSFALNTHSSLERNALIPDPLSHSDVPTLVVDTEEEALSPVQLANRLAAARMTRWSVGVHLVLSSISVGVAPNLKLSILAAVACGIFAFVGSVVVNMSAIHARASIRKFRFVVPLFAIVGATTGFLVSWLLGEKLGATVVALFPASSLLFVAFVGIFPEDLLPFSGSPLAHCVNFMKCLGTLIGLAVFSFVGS